MRRAARRRARLFRRARIAAVGAAAALVAVFAAVLITGMTSAGVPVAGSPITAPAPVAATVSASHAPAADGLQDPARDAAMSESGDTQHAAPTRLRIPAIGVDSALEDLGIDGTGALAAPVDYDLAGWFAAGVAPGQIGPAIFAGHVDSKTGPAVFARIGELGVGDEVLVDLADGETLTFQITGSQQSAKAEFPTSQVYSNVPRPEVRLITCAGAFDRSTGHYTDNLILFAALAG